MLDEDESVFDAFWQASSLDRFNIQQFAAGLNAYDSDDKELQLEYPTIAKPLPLPKSRLNKLAKARKSDRTFSKKQMPLKDLSKVLSAFYAWNGLEHRGYPSAGATYTTEIFCAGFNVEDYSGKLMYYDAKVHGVIELPGKAPSWDEASKSLNMDITGKPHLLVLFCMFPERAVAKYGERGGRFALLEAGAALQQLSLHIAESSGIKGVGVGGTLDAVWLDLLGLKATDARLAAGYLVGI